MKIKSDIKDFGAFTDRSFVIAPFSKIIFASSGSVIGSTQNFFIQTGVTTH